jgi:hypothetical protein
VDRGVQKIASTRDGQLREAVHPARLPVCDPPGLVELLRLAGEADLEATRIKSTHRTGSFGPIELLAVPR